MTKTVIIGSIAAGATVAARLRRLDEKAQITIYEKNEYVSSATCGLPYYVGGVIKDRGMLLVQTVKGLEGKFNITVKNLHEVVRIIPGENRIEVRNLSDGNIFSDSYDNLIIATGTRQNIPSGINPEHKRIFTLKTVQDADQIAAAAGEKQELTALVYGSGFVGVETAENLKKRGINTVLVGRGSHALKHFDSDLAALIDLQIKVSKIRYLQNTTVTATEQMDEQLKISLSNGETITADFMVLAAGIVPDSDLAAAAGIELNTDRSIRVDEHMRTSIPNIYAIGDVVSVSNFISGKQQHIPLAGPAYRQARACADSIAGLAGSAYRGCQNTSIIKINDLTAASTGLNTRQLEQMKAGDPEFDYLSLLVSGKSHAGYYPGSTPVIIKAFFSKKDGRILGAQGIGSDGIDKRIDVLAGFIRSRATYRELMDADLCYAPPYSSANDPVNFLGFMADNYFNSLAQYVQWSEVEEQMANHNPQYTVLDVREPMETRFNSSPGAVNIPLGALREHLDELPRDHTVAVTCAVGVRAYNAARILMQNGFKDVKVICGGMHLYRSLHWSPY